MGTVNLFLAIDDFLYYQANILIAEIKDVVNAVVFLLSDESGMISGESLRVDGGVGVYWTKAIYSALT